MRTITLFILITLSLVCKAQLWKEVIVERDIFNRNSIDLLSFNDKDRILAVGGFGNIQSIFLSTDGGNNFKYKFNITRDEWGRIQHLRFMDKDTLLLITSSGILKKAIDPFHTPEFLIKYGDYDSLYPINQGPAFFTFDGGDSAIVVGRNIFKSYDAGKTWTNTPKGINKISGSLKTGYYNPLSKTIVLTNSIYLYKSSDYGNTWDSIFNFVPLFKEWYIYANDFSFIDENTGYSIIGQDVYKTTNGGSDWDSISHLTTESFGNQNLKFFSEEIGYAIQEGLVGVYKTLDGGITWKEEFEFPERFSKGNQLFYFGDSSFFVLNNRKVYKREKASLSINKPVKNKTSATIYPNPFTNSIRVELSSPQKNTSQISIIDLQGRVLKSLFTKEQNTSLNLAELATGIYFLRIQNGNAIITKRVVKQ